MDMAQKNIYFDKGQYIEMELCYWNTELNFLRYLSVQSVTLI